MQNQPSARYALGQLRRPAHARIIRDPAMLAYLDNNDSRKGRPTRTWRANSWSCSPWAWATTPSATSRRAPAPSPAIRSSTTSSCFRREDHDGGAKTHLRTQRASTTATTSSPPSWRSAPARACSSRGKLYASSSATCPVPARAYSPAQVRRCIDELRRRSAKRYEIKPRPPTPAAQPALLQRCRAWAERIKSPVELVVGAVRSLRTPVRDLSAILLDAMDLMGQRSSIRPASRGGSGGRSWINTSTRSSCARTSLSFLLTGRKPNPDALTTCSSERGAGRRRWLEPRAALGQAPTTKHIERAVDCLMRHTLGRTPQHARGNALMPVRAPNTARRRPTRCRMCFCSSPPMPEYQLNGQWEEAQRFQRECNPARHRTPWTCTLPIATGRHHEFHNDPFRAHAFTRRHRLARRPAHAHLGPRLHPAIRPGD